MRKALKMLLILGLAASLTLLTGCWNYREVENLYIVGGLAVDKGMQGHKYHLTFEVLDLSGGTQNSSMKGKIIESEGDTVADAVKNASTKADKTLYFSDCKIAVFSREIAEAGLTPVLDWFNRDPQPRFTMQILVSQEQTAKEILTGGGSGQEVNSFNIFNMLTQTASIGRSPDVRFYQVDDMLLEEGKALVLPNIRLNAGKPEIYGVSVFHADKYAGTLDDTGAKYYCILTNSVSNGLILTGEKPEDKTIALQVQKCRADITPEINGDQIKMKINIRIQTAFDEENIYKNYLYTLGLDPIKQYAKASVEKRARQTIRSLQEGTGCDIFGFGRKVYEKAPDLWRKIKPQWDTYFRKLDCEVTAEVQITNAGFAYAKGHD